MNVNMVKKLRYWTFINILYLIKRQDEKQNVNMREDRNYNNLQLLNREVQEISLYQEFLRPILLTKHPERREGCFVGKIGTQKSNCTQFYRLLR